MNNVVVGAKSVSIRVDHGGTANAQRLENVQIVEVNA